MGSGQTNGKINMELDYKWPAFLSLTLDNYLHIVTKHFACTEASACLIMMCFVCFCVCLVHAKVQINFKILFV